LAIRGSGSGSMHSSICGLWPQQSPVSVAPVVTLVSSSRSSCRSCSSWLFILVVVVVIVVVVVVVLVLVLVLVNTSLPTSTSTTTRSSC